MNLAGDELETVGVQRASKITDPVPIRQTVGVGPGDPARAVLDREAESRVRGGARAFLSPFLVIFDHFSNVSTQIRP